MQITIGASQPMKSSIRKVYEKLKNVNEYNNESKINQSFSSKWIYTYNSSNEEIGL